MPAKKPRSKALLVIGSVVLILLLAFGWDRLPPLVSDTLYGLGESGNYADWYPQDTTPPDDLEFPCAFTPLPRELATIPDVDRRFINHAYAQIVDCIHLKLVMLEALYSSGAPLAELTHYEAGTARALESLRAESAPPGLRTFQGAVIEAIETQLTFFQKAAAERERGEAMDTVLAIPEGQAASGKLFQAWGEMDARYRRDWDPATKDSIYHHLCALDLF